MDITTTAEVRWFIGTGDIEALAAARAMFTDVTPEPRRDDHYLDVGRRDVGQKARFEKGKPVRLQTKIQVGAHGNASIRSTCVGAVERWRKLSFVVDDASLLKQGTWLRVEKVRRLRKYAFDAGDVKVVSATSTPSAGCNFELTELVVHTRSGSVAVTSVGFEAFGPEDDLVPILLTCAERGPAGAGLVLPIGASLSYPGWLERFFLG